MSERFTHLEHGKESEPKTIYTARKASDNLASKDVEDPWFVQRGYGTVQEFDDGKLVFTDLEMADGPEAARKRAEELAGADDLVLGF